MPVFRSAAENGFVSFEIEDPLCGDMQTLEPVFHLLKSAERLLDVFQNHRRTPGVNVKFPESEREGDRHGIVHQENPAQMSAGMPVENQRIPRGERTRPRPRGCGFGLN